MKVGKNQALKNILKSFLFAVVVIQLSCVQSHGPAGNGDLTPTSTVTPLSKIKSPPTPSNQVQKKKHNRRRRRSNRKNHRGHSGSLGRSHHSSRKHKNRHRTQSDSKSLVHKTRQHPVHKRNLAAEESPSEIAEAIQPETFEQQIVTNDTDSSFHLSNHLYVEALASYSKLVAQDRLNNASATFGSKLNLGAKISWNQTWTPGFETGLSLTGQSTSYSSFIQGKTLDQSSFSVGEIGLHAKWTLFPVLKLGVDLGVANQIFARAQSNTVNTLDVVAVPKLSLHLEESIFHYQSIGISLEEQFSILSPLAQPTYTISTGYDLRGALKIQSDPSQKPSLFGTLFYHQGGQNSSLANQTFSELGMSIGVGF